MKPLERSPHNFCSKKPEGCSATGAAFCLAIHPAVEAADDALGACGGFARFFADDGYLVGPREEVLAALAAFENG